MNQLIRTLSIAATCAAATLSPAAAETETTTEDRFKKAWSHSTLYSNKENNILQKLVFTGRLQADYANFDEKDAGNFNDIVFRRARAGFKASVFNDFTVHSEMDMDLNDTDPVYKRLTDSYVAWHPGDNWQIKVGKQSAGFTLDGGTSSKKLIAIERSKVAGNLWFSKEYFNGISYAAKRDAWSYKAGVFSNDDGTELDDAFQESYFLLLSAGYDFTESMDADKAVLRLDYIYQDEPDDFDNFSTKKHENVVSLNGKWQKGASHFWGDLAYAEGFSGNELFAVQLMPFYDLNETFQIVGRYTYISSSDDNQIGLSRYEKTLVSQKGDEVTELFLGLNAYFYGHKLKWQNGLQFTNMSDDANNGGEYDGVGFTSAIRISW
ncbi:MAG: porin [Coraliomargaritaceae bacterium]